jgi:hypothetical protein
MSTCKRQRSQSEASTKRGRDARMGYQGREGMGGLEQQGRPQDGSRSMKAVGLTEAGR